MLGGSWRKLLMTASFKSPPARPTLVACAPMVAFSAGSRWPAFSTDRVRYLVLWHHRQPRHRVLGGKTLVRAVLRAAVGSGCMLRRVEQREAETESSAGAR